MTNQEIKKNLEEKIGNQDLKELKAEAWLSGFSQLPATFLFGYGSYKGLSILYDSLEKNGLNNQDLINGGLTLIATGLTLGCLYYMGKFFKEAILGPKKGGITEDMVNLQMINYMDQR